MKDVVAALAVAGASGREAPARAHRVRATSEKPPSPRDKLRTRGEDEDVAARAQARVGKVLLGKYTVDAVLGIGGMAVVYAVTHRNRKRFALKLLHPERSGEIRERFLREGYVANTVDHPGAVAVLDDDTAEDGAAFLVMELLEGWSVEEMWDGAGGRLPATAVAWLADQLLDVLASAHARGIVHRDIKPANLFVTGEGQLKVLDFGIARLRESTGATLSTSTGIMLGTPAFMAPEQASGRHRDVDARTDVWAVGATMFTLLTGEIVHEADNAQALLVAAATAPPRPVGALAPDTPRAMCAVIDRALARTSEDRWPSATAMREALRAAHVEAFGGPVSRDALDALLRSPAQMHVPVAAGARGSRPDVPTLEAASDSSPAAPERHVITSPTSRSVNPRGVTEVVGVPPAAALSTARPIPLAPCAARPRAAPDGRCQARPARRLACGARGPAPGGRVCLPSRAQGAGGWPGSEPTAPTPFRRRRTRDRRNPGRDRAGERLRERRAAPGLHRQGGPAREPRSPPARAARQARRHRIPPPATSAEPPGCFFFDPQLKRLVARPGCR